MLFQNQNNNNNKPAIHPRFYPGNPALNKNADGLLCSINTTQNNIQISRAETRVEYYRNQKQPSQQMGQGGFQQQNTQGSLFGGVQQPQQQQQSTLFGQQNTAQPSLFGQQQTGLGLGTGLGGGLSTGLGGGLGTGLGQQQQTQQNQTGLGLGTSATPFGGGLGTGLGGTGLGGTGLGGTGLGTGLSTGLGTGLTGGLGTLGGGLTGGLGQNTQTQQTGLGLGFGLGQQQQTTGLLGLGTNQQQQQQQGLLGAAPQQGGLLLQQQPIQQQQTQGLFNQQQQGLIQSNWTTNPAGGFNQNPLNQQTQYNPAYPMYQQQQVDLNVDFDIKNEQEHLREIEDEFKMKFPTFSEYASQNHVTFSVGNVNLKFKNPSLEIKIKSKNNSKQKEEIKPWYMSLKQEKDQKQYKQKLNKQIYNKNNKKDIDDFNQSSIVQIKTEQQQEINKINPRAPKCNNYNLSPNIQMIQEMSDNQLTRIRDFKISNQYGCIHFLESIDLKDLNIDQIVKLKQDSVEFYPEDQFEQIPEYGKGLNVRCRVVLYNFACENRNMCEIRINNKKEFEKVVKSWMEKNNMKFISAGDDVVFELDQL
ncbi:unnamed protein product [Paramecium sonneborni]|uniref:Peptidase S59 domain-containing protein n=1 Tax=Paramecium sonneborni TaxID=65129 RepID=A0A8S1P0K2_9CILI|nr:unnamed protein product [Paramecium sonneborni]